MNIKGLRVFNNVMAYGTLNVAAQKMNASPSALSRQLSILEAELGMKLFEREKQRLHPTPEGEAFYREAKRILNTLEEIPQLVREIRRSTRRRMRVIVMPRLAPSIAIPVISEFMRSEPDVDLSIALEPRRILERSILSAEFDLGVGPLPAHHPGIRAERLGSVKPVAVMAPTHPLAKLRSLPLEELPKWDFIGLPENLLIGQQVSRMVADAGLSLSPRLQVGQALTACEFAAEGLGITVMDALTPMSLGDRVSCVPIEGGNPLDFGLLFPNAIPEKGEVAKLTAIFRTMTPRILAALEPGRT